MRTLLPLLLLTLSACADTSADVPVSEEALAAMEKIVVAPAARPDGVRFLSPATGDTVTSPVHFRFGIDGMMIAPAGAVTEGTGHHHIIVDGGAIEKGTAVPANATHIHYGGGQIEGMLNLEPGEHSITLQLADGSHISYGETWSNTITVTVSDEPSSAQKPTDAQ